MRRVIWVLLVLLGVGGSQTAWAAESAPVATARSVATLITDTDAVAQGRLFHVALRLQLAPGWHTYWRDPGDAGIAPEVTLKTDPTATIGPVQFPAPERVREGDLMTYAYTGDLVLPMAVTPGSGNITLKADANWLVCNDICVPEHGTFVLQLPAGTPGPSAQAGLFARAQAAEPVDAPWRAVLAPDGRLRVDGPGLGRASVAEAAFIPNDAGVIRDAAPQPVSLEQDGLVLHLALAKGFDPRHGISGLLSVRDRSGARMVARISASPGNVASEGSGLGRFVWLAFLGGLILNLMPCVFPVLAMKTLSFARGATESGMRHGLAYGAGVVASFAVLGGALMALRDAGASAGWGFQFQSPVFVAFMAWLLFAIGLVMSGVFALTLRIPGLHGPIGQRGGWTAAFLTGVLAVVVATPCTAPFMGAAIAGALAEPPSTGLLVFIAMGLGMALPYTVLSSVPHLGRLMPRPGVWMERLRQILALPMYAAAVWLIWVMRQEASQLAVLAVVAGLAVSAVAAWLLGRRQWRGPHWPGALAGGVVAVAAVVAFWSMGGSAEAAEAFSSARLADLRAEGRPVFVDMTAAWCVTCVLNEHVAIDRPAVQRAFEARHVAYLRGDWTQGDPAVTEFLRQYRRDGVPLYVYFPAGSGDPVLLPQILTESTLLATVARG